MRERNQGRTQEQAAVKANLRSRKTVSKYERLGKLPSELKQERTYRTRCDPFESDWGELEQMLKKRLNWKPKRCLTGYASTAQASTRKASCGPCSGE